MKAPEISYREVASSVVMPVKLTGAKTFLFRMKLGIIFIRFGIWITGMNCEIEDHTEEHERLHDD